MILEDGWLTRMLESRSKTDTIKLVYHREQETLSYEVLDGYKNVVSATSFHMTKERWDGMVEMAKKPNRVELLEDDLFRL